MRSGTARTRRMISSTVVRSLNTGMTTESSGSARTTRERELTIVEAEPYHSGAAPGNRPALVTRLVVFAPNWLGDAVMALPALADVQRALPGAVIDVAARPSIAPLYSLVPGLGQVVALGGANETASLRAHAYEAALLLTNSFSTAL